MKITYSNMETLYEAIYESIRKNQKYTLTRDITDFEYDVKRNKLKSSKVTFKKDSKVEVMFLNNPEQSGTHNSRAGGDNDVILMFHKGKCIRLQYDKSDLEYKDICESNLYEVLNEAKSVNQTLFLASNNFNEKFIVVGGVWKLNDKYARNKAKQMIKALGYSIYNDVEDWDDVEDFPSDTMGCYAIYPNAPGHFNAFVYGFEYGGIEINTKI